MDVLCVGMYRACSTWQYEVVAHLIEHHRNGRRLGYTTGDRYAELLREEQASGQGGWRALKSHEGHPAFASQLARGRARAIYSYRDARDVVYSMLHKRGTDFTSFLRSGMIHQIIANDRYWRRRTGALVQRYEDLIEAPAAGVAEIASFLGITLSAEDAEAIASQYSLESNRQRAFAIERRLREQGLDLDAPSQALRYDPQTLLHWNHLRTGRVGDWRERAGSRERAVLARLLGRWLVDLGYEADTSWSRVDRPGPLGWRAKVTLAYDIARGALACRLRCASLQFPRLARMAKQLLGIPTTTLDAVPVLDTPQAQPAQTTPHNQTREAA